MEYIQKWNLRELVKMHAKSTFRLLIFASLFFVSMLNSASAIDNPEAQDLLSEFEGREKTYLQAIDEADGSSVSYAKLYGKYQAFLDEEIKSAHQILRSKLSKDLQVKFDFAQNKWMKFRDAEFDFVMGNWTPQNFGSSSVISRGNYRNKISRDRILQLLSYIKNYL